MLYVMYIGDFMVWRGHDHIPSYEVSLSYVYILLVLLLLLRLFIQHLYNLSTHKHLYSLYIYVYILLITYMYTVCCSGGRLFNGHNRGSPRARLAYEYSQTAVTVRSDGVYASGEFLSLPTVAG